MWETIKNILSKQGGKCIILEKDRPAYIIMELEEYEKQMAGNNSSDSSKIEEVNRDIAEWRDKEKEKEAEMTESSNEEVKVEDLPF